MQRGLDFAIEIANDAPASIVTDARLLQQILKNLLSNAFKFTDHGRVDLHIRKAPGDTRFRSEDLRKAPAVVIFRVTDTGIGVPRGQETRIFEAFQQADTTITRKHGGTGLGLTISREYARILGGELALDRNDGSRTGSTFVLSLPYDPAQTRAGEAPREGKPPGPGGAETPSAPALSPPEGDERSLENRRILIVEDDARNLYATTALLEQRGATIIPASNAREAYAALREHHDIDLVLMDIMLPEIDGYQATREIRGMENFRDLPIVAVTAKASAPDRDKCREAGFNDYAVKPVEAQQLFLVITRNLRGAQ
jgi:CheY-like chemotaxis protein